MKTSLWVFFTTKTPWRKLPRDLRPVVFLTGCSVSDRIVSFTPTPTLYSHSSLSHSHNLRFMVFFRNRNVLPGVPVNPTTYSVSDRIVEFTPVPTLCLVCSHSSLSHTHIIVGEYTHPHPFHNHNPHDHNHSGLSGTSGLSGNMGKTTLRLIEISRM